MMNKIKGLVVEEQGQGMTEYGLVLGVIAVGAVGVLALLGDEIVKIFTEAKNAIINKGTTTVG